MQITIPKLTSIRAHWKLALLPALPLIAVLAMVMFFAWGQSSDQAEAAGPAPGMALAAPATVEVGSKFTVTISGNPVPPKGSPGFAGFGAEVQVSAGLKYNGINDCPSELKATVQGGGSPEVCSSFTDVAGDHAIAVLTAFTVPLPELDAAGSNEDLANFSYQCNTPGTKTITLLTVAQSPDGAQYVAPDASTIAVTTKVGDNADQITIDCGPVGGIAELPEIAGTPLEAAGSSGSNTGLIAGIVAAIAAGSVALGGAAWYARRRRLG
ncbi:MAG: hypothetical protein IIC26_02775 [Chloroflexi bacterium]|nr:hypothetical protein [Chloroflexota bacterium]